MFLSVGLSANFVEPSFGLDFKIIHNQWFASFEGSSPENITANITCDYALRVFVDGHQIGLESQGFNTVTKYVIPPNSNVIGLRCHIGARLDGGILGSFSNGLITNASWRCSDVTEQGWSEAGFDDSSWKHATVHAINSYHNASLSVPRGPLLQIVEGAAWIWTANNSIHNSTVYCRFELRKQDTPCKEGGCLRFSIPFFSI